MINAAVQKWWVSACIQECCQCRIYL